MAESLLERRARLKREAAVLEKHQAKVKPAEEKVPEKVASTNIRGTKIYADEKNADVVANEVWRQKEAKRIQDEESQYKQAKDTYKKRNGGR